MAREVTIQIRPGPGRDIEADVAARRAARARGTAGVADVRVYSKAESERLLEPWLGTGLNFDELPVPRIIVLKIGRRQRPDFARLRKSLAETRARREPRRSSALGGAAGGHGEHARGCWASAS